jgi:hypothetical protein
MERDNEYPAEGQDFYVDEFGERISQSDEDMTSAEQPLEGDTSETTGTETTEEPAFRERLSDDETMDDGTTTTADDTTTEPTTGTEGQELGDEKEGFGEKIRDKLDDWSS